MEVRNWCVTWVIPQPNLLTTVDGRDPANHLIGTLSHDLRGFKF